MDRSFDMTEISQPEAVESAAQAGPDIAEASPAEVHDWLARGEAVLVDVREPEEIEEERVAGALAMPLSWFDAERFPRLPDTRLVMMCAFGRRSRAAAERLVAAGHGAPINLTGGIYAWKEAGYPVVT